jgi:hypothetical protein
MSIAKTRQVCKEVLETDSEAQMSEHSGSEVHHSKRSFMYSVAIFCSSQSVRGSRASFNTASIRASEPGPTQHQSFKFSSPSLKARSIGT